MTKEEKENLIGKKVLLEEGDLKFEVYLTRFKNTYGRDRWLAIPVSGTGQKWIEKFIML